MYINFVLPKVFFIGSTQIDHSGLLDYLKYTDQREFIENILEAQQEGLNSGEILCSFYAKLCYASLTTEKNLNITKVRSIQDNIENILSSAHGSVLEHCFLNFVITDCSRVYTHENVRHRVGTSMSQTSGRYVRTDVLRLIIDPILEPVYSEIEYIRTKLEKSYKDLQEKMGLNDDGVSFDKKKKITSALRRILPNGQANEMGWGVNIRTLRQTIEARTSRHAEWEIRLIFNQIYQIVKDKYTMMFIDATAVYIDGQNEVTFKNKKI